MVSFSKVMIMARYRNSLIGNIRKNLWGRMHYVFLIWAQISSSPRTYPPTLSFPRKGGGKNCVKSPCYPPSPGGRGLGGGGFRVVRNAEKPSSAVAYVIENTWYFHWEMRETAPFWFPPYPPISPSRKGGLFRSVGGGFPPFCKEEPGGDLFKLRTVIKKRVMLPWRIPIMPLSARKLLSGYPKQLT